MTAEELENELSLGYTDYGFIYNGKRGAICPFNKASSFYADVVYNGQTFGFRSLEELMSAPILDGQSLNEAATEIEFYG